MGPLRTDYNLKISFLIHFEPLQKLCVISGFRLEVDENFAFLGYYAASNGNFPKRRKEITTTRCLITKKSEILFSKSSQRKCKLIEFPRVVSESKLLHLTALHFASCAALRLPCADVPGPG